MGIRFASASIGIIIGCLLTLRVASACQRFERSYETDLLSAPGTTRTLTYYVILPDAGIPVKGVVYFLHGAANTRHMIDSVGGCEEIDDLARERGSAFAFVAPDGGNSYWKNAAHTDERYQDILGGELIEHFEKEFPNFPRGKAKRTIEGISMGGHGAIETMENHPELYGAVVAHSPVFRDPGQAFAGYPKHFGQGADYLSRDPLSILLAMKKPLAGPIFLDMGGADPWLKRTLEFQGLCRTLFMEGRFEVGDVPAGKHDGDYWRPQIHKSFRWTLDFFMR
jgi:S-formylglutathione hydrolase FrmB